MLLPAVDEKVGFRSQQRFDDHGRALLVQWFAGEAVVHRERAGSSYPCRPFLLLLLLLRYSAA